VTETDDAHLGGLLCSVMEDEHHDSVEHHPTTSNLGGLEHLAILFKLLKHIDPLNAPFHIFDVWLRRYCRSFQKAWQGGGRDRDCKK
jgi:hypothetical protein